MIRHFQLLGFLALSAALVAPLPLATAASGVPPGAVEAIDKIAGEGIDQKRVASYAVGVVKDGRVVLARGYGFADLENDVPATAETIYRLGSVTKQFTAMAIMLLAEDGKLSVDDELTKFLPDYPTGGRKITLAHLLNHTSGIKDFTRTKDFPKVHRQDFTHDELLALFKDEPFDFEPGSKWGYSNSGYYLLGMVIEKASGQRYEQFLEERIFKPLSMSATRYGHGQPLIRHRAAGYRQFFGQLTNDEAISMDPPFAAGALVSNVLDLIKWHQALEAGALVSSASYEAMYRPARLANDVTRPYGYGWQLGELEGHRSIGHGGGINGFSSMITRYPDDRLAVIVLSNTVGPGASMLANRVAKVMLGIEDKTATGKPIVDEPLDAALAELLVGKYKLGEMDVELIVTDGKLFAKLNGRPHDRLKFQGGREFVHAGDTQLRITFTPSDGKADGLKVEGPGIRIAGKRAELEGWRERGLRPDDKRQGPPPRRAADGLTAAGRSHRNDQRKKTPLDIFPNGNIISGMSRAAAATDVFTAIAEPRRRQIIDLLARGGGLAVGAIVVTLALPQPTVSKHLGVLREAGIVAVSKQGQRRVYELNFERLRTVYEWVKAFEQHWTRQLDRIKARAERRAASLAHATGPTGGKKGTK